MITTILIVLLILLLIGGLPNWPYTQRWGYGWWPSGLVLVILLIVVLLSLPL